MSITPTKVSVKSLKIKHDSLEDNPVTELNISFSGGDRTTLLISPYGIIRIEYKKQRTGPLLHKLQKKVLAGFMLMKPVNFSVLRNIIITEREIREKVNKDQKDLTKRDADSDFKDFLNGISARSKKINKLQKKLSLDLIRKQSEYYCKGCKAFRPGPSLEESSVVNCKRCGELLKGIQINHLKNDIRKYLSGFWLEDCVAKILNLLGWKAWSCPNLMVYGNSGVAHQIDVLAIKKGLILIVECKTGDFISRQIKNLLAKHNDIGSHYAMVLTMGSVHPEGKKLIERNPAIKICENIRNVKKIKKLLFSL
ncbi:MAG: hypothetical protein ACKKMO_01510 [Candidatus Nealsonbacteria bacterium]